MHTPNKMSLPFQTSSLRLLDGLLLRRWRT